MKLKLILWLALSSALMTADPGRRDGQADWPPPPPPKPEGLRMPLWEEVAGVGKPFKPAKEADPCDTPEPKTFLLVGSSLAVLIRKAWKQD